MEVAPQPNHMERKSEALLSATWLERVCGPPAHWLYLLASSRHWEPPQHIQAAAEGLLAMHVPRFHRLERRPGLLLLGRTAWERP